jgi:DUF4097 and DUF4098 domain-containing protein YvlB
MKRGSLVLPLILIVIGGLFLLSNLNPSIPVFEIASRYWPFLLIGWGVLRGAEIVYTYLRGRPLPIAGLTGGEWFLAIFLILVGGGIWGFHRFSREFPMGRIHMRGLDMFGEAFDYPVSATVPAGSAKRILIENLRGNARIVAGDVQEVRVSGRATVRAFNEQEAKRIYDQIPLEVLNQDAQVLVRTNQERASNDARVSADLDITVPKTMMVECRGRYGDFDITGITGDVDVNSDNAGIRMQDIGGNVRVDLRRSDIVRAINVKGNLEIKGRGQDLELENIEGQATILATFTGDLQFKNIAKPLRYESSSSNFSVEKIPGHIHFSRGELTGNKVVGPMRVSSRTKDVRLSDFTNSLDIEVDRGDIELRPRQTPLPKMQIRTRNGDIDLALPEGAKLDLTATADHGEIDNDFSDALKLDSEGRGARLRGSVGQGPSVVLTSSRGRITVRKHVAGEEDSDWEISPRPEPSRVPRPPRAPKPPAVTQQ